MLFVANGHEYLGGRRVTEFGLDQCISCLALTYVNSHSQNRIARLSAGDFYWDAFIVGDRMDGAYRR